MSVGGFLDDSGGAVHHALLEAGIWIIEGLDLSKIPPGPCELICLPIKLLDGDGAPARAIVRPLKLVGGARRKKPGRPARRAAAARRLGERKTGMHRDGP